MQRIISSPVSSFLVGAAFLALFGVSQVLASNPVVGGASVTRVGSGATNETIVLPIFEIGADSITSCEYTLDSGAHWISTGSGSFKTGQAGSYCAFSGLNLTSLTSPNTIRVRAINNLDSLAASALQSVTLDAAPPKITFHSPQQGSDEHAEVIVQTDETADCFYSLDNVSMTSLTTTGSLLYTAALDHLPNGKHTVKVECRDWLGNQADSSASWTVAPLFKDTVNHWALEYIRVLKKRCAGVEGYRDAQGNLLSEFRPNNPISRAELVTMIVRCSYGDQPLATEAAFKDVPNSAYYSGYVKKAKELKWILGYSDDTFRPDRSISRAEALKIILLSQFSIAEVTAGNSIVSFTDVLGGWYKPYVFFGVSQGFMEGYRDNTGTLTGEFGPNNNITRAEVAKVIVKVKGWSAPE